MTRQCKQPGRKTVMPWRPLPPLALWILPLALGAGMLPARAMAADEHAGHVMPPPVLPSSDEAAAQRTESPAPGPWTDPHAGHHPAPPAPAREPQADPHAGHLMAAPDADPHAGHGAAATVPAARDPRYPPPTPEEVAAAFPMLAPHAHMAGSAWSLLLLDRLEAQDREAGTALAWDGLLSWGNAFDRAVLSSEGEQPEGGDAEVRHELLWQHAVAPWWESRLGVRRDDGEGPARHRLGIGLQGLAPQFVELSAMAYLGEAGRSAFTLVAAYDARLTNRLILQPRLELNAYGEEDVANGTGSGLADSEVGLRLRYEIRREFAPYVGVEWSRLHGDTADVARASAERTGEARAVAGLRVWF